MANEIQISARLTMEKGSMKTDRNVSNNNATMSGDAYSQGVQQIGTAATGEVISLSADIGTLGVAFFRNLDAANSVSIGHGDATNFYSVVTLKAGEPAVLRLGIAATNLYAKATGGAVNLEYLVVED